MRIPRSLNDRNIAEAPSNVTLELYMLLILWQVAAEKSFWQLVLEKNHPVLVLVLVRVLGPKW
jgi:hypothetical protein